MSTQTRKVLLVASAHALVCLAVFDYCRRALGVSAVSLLVHAPLVVAALLAALIAAGTTARLAGHWRGTVYMAALFPALAVTALLALDIASFATSRSLGIGLTHSLVALWMEAWWDGEQLLPLSPGIIAGALAGVAVTVAAELVIWARTLEGMWPPVSAVPSMRPAAIAAAILLVCGAPVLFEPVSSHPWRSELIGADPVLAFVSSNWASVDAPQQALFDRLRREEPKRRAAYDRQQTFDRKNVIVITVDSLRADHLPLHGYSRPTTPFLSRLHREGTLRRVEFATSICAESNCGILSTLFSKTLRHQVAGSFSLFTLLKDQGYDVHFILSGNHDWMGQREMYGDAHTSYFDGRDSSRYGWSDDRLLVEGLEQVGNYQRPAFFFFHLMSPHIMGHKEARYRLYEPAVVQLDMAALFRGEYDQTSVVNNYDNGLVQADATIRDLFGVLDRKGYLQNSMVVILADHGEALGERAGMYGHINWLYQETIRIPMLIYDASETTYAGLAFGTQLDVAPTVVDRLGLPIPPDWEGVSLLRAAAPRQTMHQTRLTKPCFAIIDYALDRMLKYMQCQGGKNEQLYDLMSDPGEQHDRARSADPAVVAGFRAALDQWRSR